MAGSRIVFWESVAKVRTDINAEAG